MFYLPICADRQTFSVKSQKVNISGFVDHMGSGGTPQLCSCDRKAAIDNMSVLSGTMFQENFTYKNRQQAGFGPWLQFADVCHVIYGGTPGRVRGGGRTRIPSAQCRAVSYPAFSGRQHLVLTCAFRKFKSHQYPSLVMFCTDV